MSSPSTDHLYITVPIMVVCAVLFLWLWFKDKNYQPGKPSLIPYTYIKLTLLIIFVVLAANLVTTITGVKWQSPFSSY